MVYYQNRIYKTGSFIKLKKPQSLKKMKKKYLIINPDKRLIR